MTGHPWCIAAETYEHMRAREREPIFIRQPLAGYLIPKDCYAIADQLRAFLCSDEGKAARRLLKAYGHPLVIVTNCELTSVHPGAYVLTGEGPAVMDCDMSHTSAHPCTAEELVFAAMLQGVQPQELLPGIRKALDAIADVPNVHKHPRISLLTHFLHKETV